MSLVSLPSNFLTARWSMPLVTTQRVASSPFGGSEQAVDLLNDYWTASAVVPACYGDEAAATEAFVAAMRGQVNTVALHHFRRPVPRGTLRGTLTLAAAAAQGAGTLSVTGGASQAAKTLLAGDLLGVGGLLVMVAADCVANGSGVVTVPIANRLRAAKSSGTAVTWDRPTALFRLMAGAVVAYSGGMAEETPLEFKESL